MTEPVGYGVLPDLTLSSIQDKIDLGEVFRAPLSKEPENVEAMPTGKSTTLTDDEIIEIACKKEPALKEALKAEPQLREELLRQHGRGHFLDFAPPRIRRPKRTKEIDEEAKMILERKG